VSGSRIATGYSSFCSIGGFPSILKTMTIIQAGDAGALASGPAFVATGAGSRETLGGRPPISGELRALIRRMSLEKRAVGCTAHSRRVCSSSASWVGASRRWAKYMAKKGDDPPSGQSWSTFLRNHMPHIAAHRFVRRSNHWLSFTLRPRHCSAGSARAGVDQCDGASDGRMDCATDHRSVFPGTRHHAT